MELHFQSSDISVSGNLLILNPYRFFQIYCIRAVWRGQAERAEPQLISACSCGESRPNGEASETFLLHRFLLAESAVPSGAQTPKWDTRASGNDWRGDGAFGAAATLPPGCDRCSRPVSVATRDRRSQQGAGFYWALKGCTGTVSPREAQRHERRGLH